MSSISQTAISNKQHPYISVILTAFNRKQYLPLAIRSIANQTLEKSKYEIIVVKNFYDELIDSQLKKLDAKSIIKGNENIGAYLVSAIENSKGEVMVFLDDDDEFEPNKLQIVHDLFKNDTKLGYFHNDRKIIDARGELIEQSKSFFRSANSANIQSMGSFCVAPPLSQTDAYRLLWVCASFYMSSLAIRKMIVLPFMGYLSSLDYGQDFFMFYSALAHKRCHLAILSAKLTKYRVHQDNVSTSKGDKSKDQSDLLFKYEDRQIHVMKFSTVIMRMVDEAGLDQTVKRMISQHFWVHKLNYDIAMKSPGETVFRDSLANIRYAIPSLFSVRGLRLRLRILLHSLSYVVFPNYERKYFLIKESRNW